MGGKYEWLLYVGLAGLAWGTYVPLIAYGGKQLENNRFGAILCVGIAYVFIAVLLPLVLFASGKEPWPALKPVGLTFSCLAGAAGAIGAVCVVFATRAAGGPKASNALFIAPLIFGLAPVINTLVNLIWDPKTANWYELTPKAPHFLLVVGILLVGLGAGLVLYSKELSERHPAVAEQKEKKETHPGSDDAPEKDRSATDTAAQPK